MTKRLAVIDGKSVFYRGYYSMPNLSTKDGIPTGGVYGFAALSLEVIKKLKPDYVAVAWDKPKTNIRRRKELYPAYKAGRKPAPADFYEQIPILHELLEAFGWPLYEYDDYEADDIMGALAVKAAKEDIETCLVTSDLDMLQLINGKVHVYVMKKGFTQIDQYDPETFEQKYGIAVDQFLDLKSLKGDSSDNIPGVPGVGEKTAVQLLQDYKTLDGVYEHLPEIKETLRKKLEAGKDSAYLSKEIARIWVDAPVPFDLEGMDVTKFDKAKLRKLLTELEFKSLIRNLGSQLDEVEESVEAAAADITPAAINELTDAGKAQIAMADFVAVAKVGDDWLVSPNATQAYLVGVQQAGALLQGRNIIAHDAKPLLKELLNIGVSNLPVVQHDTRIAHFMLNSLDRNRELGDIVGVHLDKDEGDLTIGSIWHLYEQQVTQLKDVPKLASLAKDVEFPTIAVLARVEQRGILLNTEFLEAMSTEFTGIIGGIEKQIHEHAGYEFNISSPSQLAEVLYGKLQLSTIGIKKGKTGYSTGQKELDKLRGTHPIIELIEQYREYTKLKSTYIDSLPKLVDSESRLHTTFSLDVAATGRLSSHDPNLQNIPIRSDIGRKIREAFVPAKGNRFVSADYSQFELRLAAVLAGDKKMINDFNGDTDIHAKTASEVYGVPMDNVTKRQRRDAKVINFGVLYGMSPHGLAAATGMSFADAKDFIAKYFQVRGAVREYIDTTIERAKHEGYVETLFGRRRPTPDLNSSNFVVREAAKRAAANMPIQGTEADLMKIAMIEVGKRLGDLGDQVLQIHDSILVECPENNVKAVCDLLVDTMENIYPELGVKLKVDVSVGDNWGEL
jgi:DNA polymerase-1